MSDTPREKLTYISIFSGIEAASVAWEPLGFEPAAFAEVDPFPSAVLKKRYPHVPNLGDITKIDWSDYHGKIDIVVGGSPCQSFSIAGKREGLAGESGLMFEYIRAVREIRPKLFIWENVQGALSSEKGEAFRQLLSEMDDLGYGLAWRVLDAQFVRVPDRHGEGFVGPVAQRRRRIFLVGCLGDPEGAAEILFEPDSLRWDHPSSREKRKELAAAAQSGVGSSYTMLVRCGKEGGGKGALVQEDVSATLSTANMQTIFQPAATDRHAAAFAQSEGDEVGAADGGDPTAVILSNGEDIVGALCACDAKGANSQYVNDGKLICLTGRGNEEASRSVRRQEEKPAERASHAVVCMASGQARAEIECDMAPAQAARQHKDPQVVCFNAGNANDVAHIGETQLQTAPSLRASRSGTNGTPVVCTTQYGEDVAGTLTARHDSSPCADRGQNVVCMSDDNANASIDFGLCGALKVGGSAPIASDSYVVRRLTPRECERLQGFPDDWTRIAYRGKTAEDCPDAPRYKALGNSMAVPVMRWIGERIPRAEQESEADASQNQDGWEAP